MLEIFNGLRNMTLLSITVRMLLAMFCGGLIGIEREFKRRPAGFRTHILICVGAAITTMTSQYLFVCLGYYTDMARMGAQVVAGIGFIGAGTIIVTNKQRVKGLTTAAGLWSAAIVGLAIGGGFFEGGLLATVLVLFAELLFVRLEYRLLRSVQERLYYIEYTGRGTMDDILTLFRSHDVRVLSMEINRSEETAHHNASAFFHIRVSKNVSPIQLVADLKELKGVYAIDEIY